MSFELTVLGISSATPTIDRHPSAQFLSFGNHNILLDCGEGAQMQLLRAGIKAFRINKIFISHLHPDHFLGLPGLLGTYSLKGRSSRLDIYAPAGLQEIMELQFRLCDMHLSFNIHFHTLEERNEAVIFEDNCMKVTAYQLQHRMPCWGFAIQEMKLPRSIIKERVEGIKLTSEIYLQLRNGQDYVDNNGQIFSYQELTRPNSPPASYAYITDTLFLPEVAERLKGIRILYHEATFLEDKIEKALATSHSTARQAAEFASIAEVEKLIIGHFSSRYHILQPLLDEARNIFPNTVLAEEGRRYELAC